MQAELRTFDKLHKVATAQVAGCPLLDAIRRRHPDLALLHLSRLVDTNMLNENFRCALLSFPGEMLPCPSGFFDSPLAAGRLLAL